MTSMLPVELQQLEELVLQKLPVLVENSPQVQNLVNELAGHRRETQDRFYELLNELRRDREAQLRKSREQDLKWNAVHEEIKALHEEQIRKWDEQDRKWDEQVHKWDKQDLKWQEQDRKWEKIHEENMAFMSKHERSIGALGARWGTQSEASFRNALAAILEKSFGVDVLNINEYDDEGMVFGRPDQVELDVIIKNGLLIICEIKSSLDKAGMYIFERKVRFYEKRHQRSVSRMIVISPMVDARARPVAERLGIEVYSDSIDVKV